MDVWDLLMKYFMYVIAGVAGGLSVAIFLDTQLVKGIKPFLTIFYLLLGFIAFLLFAKAREISKKRK